MEIAFENERIRIKVKTFDSMVKLEGRYILDKLPKTANRSPIKVRKLKSGKVMVYQELYIPNGFIYDAMCINDKEANQQISEWFKNMVKDIAKQRGVELPKEWRIDYGLQEEGH